MRQIKAVLFALFMTAVIGALTTTRPDVRRHRSIPTTIPTNSIYRT
jgi:hypothetical protein